MIGAQNARTLVKNQCRQNTTSSVFLVRIHVCRTIAPAMFAFLPTEGAFEAEVLRKLPAQERYSLWWCCLNYRSLADMSRSRSSAGKGIQRHAEEAKKRQRLGRKQLRHLTPTPLKSIVNRMPSARRLVGRHPCRFARATLHFWRRNRARSDFLPTLTNRSLGRHSGAQMPSA